MAKRSKFGSVRPLERNKFQASYKKKVNGETRTFYAPHWFPSKTEANAWLTNEESLIIRGIWTVPGTPDKKNTEMPTFEAYALSHIQLQTTSKGEGLRNSVKGKYTSYLNNQLAQFKAIPIDAITRQMVDEWWQAQVATGKRTTASKAYKFMHAVFDRASDPEHGWIAASPCKVKGAQNASTGKETTAATIAELELLAENINPRYKVLLYVATYGAMRFGEVAALQVGDFALKSDGYGSFYEITVSRQVVRVGGAWEIGPTKNEAGKGVIRLHAALTPLVTHHLATLPTTGSADLVFPAATGGFLHNGVLAKEMKLAASRCNLSHRKITPHSLRRGGATDFVNSGANLDETKLFLRDKSAAAASRYIKATDRKAELVQSMTSPFTSERTTLLNG